MGIVSKIRAANKATESFALAFGGKRVNFIFGEGVPQDLRKNIPAALEKTFMKQEIL